MSARNAHYWISVPPETIIVGAIGPLPSLGLPQYLRVSWHLPLAMQKWEPTTDLRTSHLLQLPDHLFEADWKESQFKLIFGIQCESQWSWDWMVPLQHSLKHTSFCISLQGKKFKKVGKKWSSSHTTLWNHNSESLQSWRSITIFSQCPGPPLSMSVPCTQRVRDGHLPAAVHGADRPESAVSAHAPLCLQWLSRFLGDHLT